MFGVGEKGEGYGDWNGMEKVKTLCYEDLPNDSS